MKDTKHALSVGGIFSPSESTSQYQAAYEFANTENLTRFVAYFTADELGLKLPDGLVVKLTLEYAPELEIMP